MPKGTPLTPEQLGRAAEVHARTGSYTEAAREIGAPDPSTVRKALVRQGNPNRSQLNARATLAGILRGRNALASITAEVRVRTRKGKRETPTAEELLVYARTLHFTVGRLVSLVELALHERREKLSRAKLRAEIDALKKGTLLSTEQILALLASLPREEVLKVIAALKARRDGAADASAPPAAAAPLTTTPGAT